MKKIVCHHCQQPISGSYVEAIDKHWHPGHFLCRHCRLSLESGYVVEDGEPYCQTCYNDLFAERCTSCNRVINGEYCSHDEHVYCRRCYETLVLPRCDVCGQPMKTNYIVNDWGHQYCERHASEYQTCSCCGRLACDRLTRGSYLLPDGRPICGHCQHTAVSEPEQCSSFFLRVAEIFFKLGLDRISINFPVRLVDKYRLQKTGIEEGRLGLTSKLSRVQISGLKENSIAEILILSHLSHNHFCAVAAHEFGHAWMHLNGFPTLPPVVEEGLCELMAYQWLKSHHNPESHVYSARMLSNDHPIYGEGFRQARVISRSMSLSDLLDCVKFCGNFPT